MMIRKPVMLGALAALLLMQTSMAQSQTSDLTEYFSQFREVERLRYFKEINVIPVIDKLGLTGNDVRITIMGEMVDPTHPDIASAVINQFNAFVKQGEVIQGPGNQQFRSELLQHGDGHGTHIAGTIAAACDEIGIAGVACGATLDVYALGAYDNASAFYLHEPDEKNVLSNFLNAFNTALSDVTRRGVSKIVTGSFNIEGPAIINSYPGYLSENQLLGGFEENSDGLLETILNSPFYSGVSDEDKDMLRRVTEFNGNDPFIPLMSLSSHTQVFADLADTISDFQKSGGVYIVTESNYQFEDRTSVLNATPTLMEQVDPDLWLSVVMVQPVNFEQATTQEEIDNAMAGQYVAPINSCGLMARDYCIVVPSYEVLSTMSEQVSEESLPVFMIEGRTYQSFSGHSMGAPMVAAALALMQEHSQNQNLNLSMKELVGILKQSANRTFIGYDPDKHGRGMLDIMAAITAMGT